MNTALKVVGPFVVPVSLSRGVKRINKQDIRAFWEQDEMDVLGQKTGCYVFATRASGGGTPWYVGQSTKGFRHEVFGSHQLVQYNDVLHSGRKGTPVLFFVVRSTSNHGLKRSLLTDVERVLTHYAYAKNPSLKNTQNTKNQPNWTIAGVIRGGPGKKSEQANRFKTVMGISKY